MYWLLSIFILFLIIAMLSNYRDIKKWRKILGYKPNSDELITIINLEAAKIPQDEIIQILQYFNSKTFDKKAIKELIKDRKRKIKQQIADEKTAKNLEKEQKLKAKLQELKNQQIEMKAKKQALQKLENNYKNITSQEVIQAEIIEEYPENTPIEIIDFYERQEFDAMRFALQKVAYEMVGNRHTQQEKDNFKKVMTYFAYKDPLYNDCIKRIIGIIAKNEGILQTKIYPYFSEYDTEIIRYVLYFGNELGDIYRVKSGKSYKLYTNNQFVS